MPNRYTLLEQTLRKHGYSLTKPRQAVFDILKNHGPLATQSIITSLAKSVNRASVYRTIALFENLGIVQRLQFGWKYNLELSDAFQRHHHHFLCVICNQIFTIKESPRLEHQISALVLRLGFKPTSHQLEIQGKCKACKSVGNT